MFAILVVRTEMLAGQFGSPSIDMQNCFIISGSVALPFFMIKPNRVERAEGVANMLPLKQEIRWSSYPKKLRLFVTIILSWTSQLVLTLSKNSNVVGYKLTRTCIIYIRICLVMTTPTVCWRGQKKETSYIFKLAPLDCKKVWRCFETRWSWNTHFSIESGI